MEIYGNVTFWKNSNNIEFNFNKINKKNIDKPESAIDYGTINLPFEIWQKFKGNKVKITIEKVK